MAASKSSSYSSAYSSESGTKLSYGDPRISRSSDTRSSLISYEVEGTLDSTAEAMLSSVEVSAEEDAAVRRSVEYYIYMDIAGIKSAD